MRPILRRGLATGSVLLSCVGCVRAQQPAPSPALPRDMLLVGERGSVVDVELGVTARDALATVNELYPNHEGRRVLALHNMRSELGRRKYRVVPFYLGRFAVTNAAYQAYLAASARAGRTVRFPYHWWAEGRADDLAARRAAIAKLYPDDKQPTVLYWADHWRELPFAIPAGQEQWPVAWVSYADALRCAGFYGMRLPTEPEWTAAASGGDPKRQFVFGEDLPGDLLARLDMKEQSQRGRPRPVGGMGPLAVGPYGHGDLFGQVWELVIPVGFQPQNGPERFRAEARALERSSISKRLEGRPLGFGDDFAVVKGGSCYSLLQENWVELRINTRARVHEAEVLPGVGFRLAKTDRPGFDLALARLRLERPRFLTGAQEPDHPRQVGIERYRLTADGAGTAGYDAVSYVPLSHVELDDGAILPHLQKLTWNRPEMIGVLITTVALKEPALAPGIYVVHHRTAGVPRDLRDAVGDARRALRKQGPEAQGPWREVLARHGYEVNEVASTAPATLLRQVYLRNGRDARVPVPTGHDVLVYRSGDGRWAAVQKVPAFRVRLSTDANPNRLTRSGAELALETWVPVGRQAALAPRGRKWRFTVPLELTAGW